MLVHIFIARIKLINCKNMNNKLWVECEKSLYNSIC